MTKKLIVIIDKILELIYFFKQPNTNDGNKTNIGTTDQRIFIICNSPPSGHNFLPRLKSWISIYAWTILL